MQALRMSFSGKVKGKHYLKLLSLILSCTGKNEHKDHRFRPAIPTPTDQKTVQLNQEGFGE